MPLFTETIAATIARYRMLSVEDRILVGVSGGADSVGLLFALHQLGYRLGVAHLNHGLRGDAIEDERFVVSLANSLSIPCFTARVAVRERGGNMEAEGRNARKEFFQSVAQQEGFTKIALAHNREDRVETFLLHLMRGAGSEGLVSMTPMSGMIVRPFIDTSRAEIESYLNSQNQPWRTDCTNTDISFARNRIRHQTIPELASSFNSRLIEGLARTVSVLHGEDQWMSDMTDAWLSQFQSNKGIDVEALRKVPTALARRVIRAGLRNAGSLLTNVTFDHVESVRTLLEPGKSGKVIPLPGGITAAREFEWLVFLNERETEAREFDYALSIPGIVRIPELKHAFRAELVEHAGEPSDTRVFVDGSQLGACVTIRNWKPGDYYKPAGWPAGKVKKLFQSARVPRSKRNRWPVFVTNTTIVWVASFPVSREFIPGGHSEKIVAFETLPD
jgi:tRNA(Ile)-lysidine synthase